MEGGRLRDVAAPAAVLGPGSFGAPVVLFVPFSWSRNWPRLSRLKTQRKSRPRRSRPACIACSATYVFRDRNKTSFRSKSMVTLNLCKNASPSSMTGLKPAPISSTRMGTLCTLAVPTLMRSTRWRSILRHPPTMATLVVPKRLPLLNPSRRAMRLGTMQYEEPVSTNASAYCSPPMTPSATRRTRRMDSAAASGSTLTLPGTGEGPNKCYRAKAGSSSPSARA